MNNNIIDKYIKKLKSDNKGIALLFTLGILSLLLVLAIAFATNAIVERKVAATNVESAKSKLLAETAMKRVLGFMKETFEDTTNSSIYPPTDTSSGTYFIELDRATYGTNISDKNILISYDSTSPNFDHIHGLKTKFQRTVGTDSIIIDWTSTTPPTAWQEIKHPTSNEIIGRVAYLVIDESGKIDPNHVSSSDQNRLGVSSTEINWKAGDKGSIANDHLYSYTPAISLDTATTGKLSSWETITPYMPTQTFVDSALKILSPYSEPDREAYLDTSNKTLYNRFNLARTDWNTPLTVASISTTAPSEYIKGGSPSHYARKCNASNIAGGIGWLYNWSDAGTFKDSTPTDQPVYRANQIAANLIDYCDSNSTITTDSTTNPTYTGLEETPYINEIGIYYEIATSSAQTATAPPVNEWTKTYTINGKVLAEAINMYDNANFNSSTKFQILEGSIAFDYIDASGATKTKTIDLAVAANYQSSDPEVAVNTGSWTAGYKFNIRNLNTTPISMSIANSNNSDLSVTNLKVQIARCQLTYNSILCDFAKPDLTANTIGFTSIAAGGGSAKGWLSYQVDDPRQNLNDEDWGTPTYSEDPSSTYGNDSTGAANAQYGSSGEINNIGGTTISPNPGGDADPEPNANFVQGSFQSVSTAYIRNAPMESPWELGAIHRGGAWETINLKKYSAASGGGAYADGDAKILDQIKMTDKGYSYGKININSPYEDVQEALLSNIKVGLGAQSTPATSTSDYQALGTQGTTLTDAQVKSIATAIINKVKTQAFTNRGEVANVSGVTDGTLASQTTDAQKEAIIGKFINLTTTKQNYFTIVVLAQGIKDIGGNGTDIIIRKDLDNNGAVNDSVIDEPANDDINGNGVLGESNIPDPNGDTDGDGLIETIPAQIGRYDHFADEILSEKKIIAVVYRDTITNKFEIISYQVIEE